MHSHRRVKCDLKSINYNFPKDFFQDFGADEVKRSPRLASLEMNNKSHSDIPKYGLKIKLNFNKQFKGTGDNSRYL